MSCKSLQGKAGTLEGQLLTYRGSGIAIMLTGIIGILKAGGAYVPINADFPQERISYILEDTGAAVAEAMKGTMQARQLRRLSGKATRKMACRHRQPAGQRHSRLMANPIRSVKSRAPGLCDLYLRLDREAQGGRSQPPQHCRLCIRPGSKDADQPMQKLCPGIHDSDRFGQYGIVQLIAFRGDAACVHQGNSKPYRRAA